MDCYELFDETLSDLSRCSCTSYYCSTCGGQFTKVRKRLVASDKLCVRNFLSSLRFDEFANYGFEDNWRLFIRHLLLQSNLISSDEAGEIIEKWYRKVPDAGKADFVDFIVFYFLRYLPEEDRLKKHWISEGLRYIEATRSSSLIETLVLVMGNDCPREVLVMAISDAEFDEQMKRVLINACGHSIVKAVK
jgi:hypothetical protein